MRKAGVRPSSGMTSGVFDSHKEKEVSPTFGYLTYPRLVSLPVPFFKSFLCDAFGSLFEFTLALDPHPHNRCPRRSRRSRQSRYRHLLFSSPIYTQYSFIFSTTRCTLYFVSNLEFGLVLVSRLGRPSADVAALLLSSIAYLFASSTRATDCPQRTTRLHETNLSLEHTSRRNNHRTRCRLSS
jgi:hypothetical protein